MSLYATLELPETASAEEIKSAYRRLSKKHHPDRGGSHIKMAAINKAYEILSDPERRKAYDENGQITPPTPLEAQARQLLLMLFAQVIEKRGESVNYVSRVRKALGQGIGTAKDKIVQIKRTIEKLEAALPKVEVEEGSFNAFAAIVQQKIDAAKTELAGMQIELQKGELAKEMLEKYKCGIIEKASGYDSSNYYMTGSR